jgi:hypothetical protein
MDDGRKLDLQELDAVLNDPTKSRWAKNLAYRSKKKILLQLKDKRLTQLRQWVINAQRQHDYEVAEKLTYLIKDHTKESRNW